jgi:hypothetical protein
MTKITIAGQTIEGNEVNVSISASVVVESNPWQLRDVALNSRSTTGHKSIEIETLSGKRVLVQASKGIYVDVPLNNNDIILNMDKVYAVTTVSISGTAVDASGLDTLGDAYKASMEYYVKKRIIQNKINDGSISYDKKNALLADLLAIEHSGLEVSIPGITGTDWEFAESGGLNVSYWSNGPYADIKINIEARKLITIQGE